MLLQDDLVEFAHIAGFKGQVMTRGGRGYAAARQIFNMRADEVNPSLILKARDENDVALVMQCAARSRHPIGLRSGGHNTDGTAMAAPVVLDLSGMRELHVDVERRRIRLGPGILLGDLDAACQDYKMIVPTGTVGTTGVAGLTLGGGVGFKMRELGASVDNLVRCRVVTTEGRIVTASAEDNPDLFWALRGAGANFGVVTELEFRAHPFHPVANVGQIIFPARDLVRVMVELSAFMEHAPRELGVIPAVTRPPRGMPLAGRDPVLMVLALTTGDATAHEEYVSTIASFGTALMKKIEQMPWSQANTMLEAGAPAGLRSFSGGGYSRQLDEAFFGTLLEMACLAPDLPELGTFLSAGFFCGGAFSEDFAEDSTAFSRENARFLLEVVSVWESRRSDPEGLGWVNRTMDALRPMMLPNGYINLTCDNDPEWVRRVYGKPEKYQRLAKIKAAWDPHNLLRFNRNIVPQP